MSATLLNATLAYLRAEFTPAQITTLQAYGGEFNSEESAALSYACPAVLLTVLGWRHQENSARLAGRNVRAVRMAAFVVTNGARRETRLAAAMTLADMLALKLRQWAPAGLDLPVQLAPLDEEPACENMYGRAMDRRGQALWLVSWEQEVKPLVPLPVLYDLLAIEIIDTTRQGVTPASAVVGGTLTVTEEINFAPLPPLA